MLFGTVKTVPYKVRCVAATVGGPARNDTPDFVIPSAKRVGIRNSRPPVTAKKNAPKGVLFCLSHSNPQRGKELLRNNLGHNKTANTLTHN